MPSCRPRCTGARGVKKLLREITRALITLVPDTPLERRESPGGLETSGMEERQGRALTKFSGLTSTVAVARGRRTESRRMADKFAYYCCCCCCCLHSDLLFKLSSRIIVSHPPTSLTTHPPPPSIYRFGETSSRDGRIKRVAEGGPAVTLRRLAYHAYRSL